MPRSRGSGGVWGVYTPPILGPSRGR